MSRHRGCSHIQSVVAQPVFTSRVSRSFSRLQRRLLQRELPGKRRVLDPSDAFPETLPRVLSHDRQAPHLRHEPNLQWRQLHARMAGLQGWLREPRLRLLAGAGEAAHAHQQRGLRIQVGCVGYHMCGILFILQRISISNIYIYYLNNACGISTHCTLLDCESLIHVNLISVSFVVHAWHLRFPSNGIKKYLIWLGWQWHFGRHDLAGEI